MSTDSSGTSTGFFTKLFKYGELPTVSTNVSIDTASLYSAAAALFIAAFLIALTWYTFRKLA